MRDTAEPFVSAVRENLAGRTEALEDLAVELFARGLSTRDIEAAFTDAEGQRLVSRAAGSESSIKFVVRVERRCLTGRR